MTEEQLIQRSAAFAARYMQGVDEPGHLVDTINMINCAGHGFWMGYHNPRGHCCKAASRYFAEQRFEPTDDQREAFAEGFRAGVRELGSQSGDLA